MTKVWMAKSLKPSPDEITEDTNEDFPEDQIEASNESDEASSDLESVETEDLTDMDFSDEFSILKEMQEDMREHFENEYAGEAILGNSRPKKNVSSSLTLWLRKLPYRSISLSN